MRRAICITIMLFAAMPVAATEKALQAEVLTNEQPIFVLKHIGPAQGIVRVDLSTGRETPFSDFIHTYWTFNGAWGGFQLATVGDRVLAQGSAYYEFAADSGQLLRRYPALASPYDSWAFHGAVVDRATGLRLGIPPGIYGQPRCTQGPNDMTGQACRPPDVPFPGYLTRSNLTEQHVLLRRGLDPQDTTLTVVKTFSPSDFGVFAERFVALDYRMSRLMFWVQGSDSAGFPRQQFSTADITSSGVADEQIHHVSGFPSSIVENSTISVAFDSTTDAALRLVSYYRPNGQRHVRRLVRESLDGSELAAVDDVDPYSLDSVAAGSPILPDTYVQMIPVVGEADGANGTYWRSDAWFFNPSSDSMDVEVQRLGRDDVKRFKLAAGASRTVTNVLRELGGGRSGDGSLSDAVTVRSPYRAGAQLSVYSRTWTPAPTGGTYGQAVPAVPSESGYSNHLAQTTTDVSTLHSESLLLMDRRDPSQFRHNIGVVNVGGEPLTIRLVYEYAPPKDRVATLNVPPRSLRQFSLDSLFPSNLFATVPPYIMVDGDRPAIIWLSIVDNRTGDASFVPFTWFAVDAGPESRLVVPGVIHSPGANGTYWRTDVYGKFRNGLDGGTAQHPEVNFRGPCGDGSLRKLLPVAPGEQFAEWPHFWWTTFADVARQWCAESNDVIGAMEVRTGSWMTMVARTYTTRADGGTYGDILPLYPPRGWPSRHFAGIVVSDSFRVNIGLYNGFASLSTTVLRLFDEEGSLVGEVRLPLAGYASVQQNLLAMFPDLKKGTYGLTVSAIDGLGCWPYVSMVDNVTGDPTNWW